jgi:hypothetical protein
MRMSENERKELREEQARKERAGKEGVRRKTSYPKLSAVSSRTMLGPTPVDFLRLAAKR